MDRHLAAILAADVVGYSRLIKQDEVGTIAAVKANLNTLIEPKITQHNGRIVKLMGDGLLAEFPSVVDAVQCAVDIQQNITKSSSNGASKEQLVYRLGINIGDIVVDGDDIHGDGVNIAARLEALSKPGGICISRNVFDQVKDKLDLSFEHQGRKKIKSVAEPITIYSVHLDDKAAALASPVIQPRKKSNHTRGAYSTAAALALLVVIGGMFWWQPWAPEFEPARLDSMAFPLPDKPSIAVLPFDNMSGDASQEYFADGMTEDLITDLSKISGLFVIARNSTFTYKGKPVSIRQVAEDLGVRYVLEGSVRRSGDQLRVNAQLIDATTGGHLWAERYDGSLDNVFALQDQLTQQIVRELALNLTPEDVTYKRSKTNNAEAYDAFLLGWSQYRRNTQNSLVQALSYFQQAVKIDPSYTHAYAAIAAVYRLAVDNDRFGATTLWSQKLGLNTDTAIEEMRRYLKLAPKKPNSLAHQVASSLLYYIGRHEAAIVEAEQAIKLDRNDPDGYKALASAQIFAGKPSKATAEIRTAIRLDPHPSGDYSFWLGLAQFGMGEYKDAVETLAQAAQHNPDNERNMIVLASAYGHLGDIARAREAIDKVNRLRHERLQRQRLEYPDLQPGVDVLLVGDYTLSDVDFWPFKDTADRQRLRDGLQLAGVPASDAAENVSPNTISGATTVDASMANELHRRGVSFVDVRGDGTWDTGHVPGAVHLYLKTDFNEVALKAAIEKDQPVVFYCAGPRCLLSSKACLKAIEWGFEQVYYFREGFPSWKAAGYPVEVAQE